MAHATTRVPVNSGDMLILATEGLTGAHLHDSPTDFFGKRGFGSMFRQPKGHSSADAGSVLAEVIALAGVHLDEAAVLVVQFG